MAIDIEKRVYEAIKHEYENGGSYRLYTRLTKAVMKAVTGDKHELAAEKPQAPAGLVEELREWAKKETKIWGSSEWDGGVQNGYESARYDVDEILSKYSTRKEVVLDNSKDIDRLCYAGYTIGGKVVSHSWKYNGCKGRLIFVPDEKDGK